MPSNGSDAPKPTRADRQRIESYGGGGFRINGTRHEGSVIVLPEATLAWPVDDASKLTVESLAPVLDAKPPVEILLFGGGKQLVPADPAVAARLRAAGIAIEPMDTGAACRTYSVLSAEERRVAAALIAVD